MDNARYGDLGTFERSQKFGGSQESKTDCGQPQVVVISSYLEAFLHSRIFDQEQYNSASQLCRDYEIGILRRWNITADYLRESGLPVENGNDLQEEARKCYNHAVRWNPSVLAISALVEMVIDEETHSKMAAFRRREEMYKRIADSLTKYYCNHNRDDVLSKLRAS